MSILDALSDNTGRASKTSMERYLSKSSQEAIQQAIKKYRDITGISDVKAIMNDPGRRRELMSLLMQGTSSSKSSVSASPAPSASTFRQ